MNTLATIWFEVCEPSLLPMLRTISMLCYSIYMATCSLTESV